MLSLKEGVQIGLMQPQMVLAASIIEMCYREIGIECIITSGNDGQHMSGSLHYMGEAIDVRTREVPEGSLDTLIQRIRECLGHSYDVVLEPTHIHVEYDPKERTP